MFKKIGIIFITLLLLSILTTTFSATNNLDSNKSDINNYLEESFKAANYSYATVIITNKEKPIYSLNYGNISTFHEEFAVGSISKSFTALAIIQFVEQRKVELNTPISAYLDVNKINKNLSPNITVLQLLHQTSGLHAYHFRDIALQKKQMNSFTPILTMIYLD